MGLPTADFKRILRAYDLKRQRNRRLLDERKQEVYGKLPALRDIEEQIAGAGIKTTRLIMAEPDKRAFYMDVMKDTLESLKETKAAMLRTHGYPEDYLQPIYDCPDCQDTGYIGSGKCHCLKQAVIDKAYEQSNLSDVLEAENFNTFKLDYYDDAPDPETGKSPRAIAERNLKVCRHFVDTFGSSFGNLVLHGQAGLGKTFLCNAIAKALLDQGRTVIYLTAFQLFKLLENYRFRSEESGVTLDEVEPLYTCDLLIIDDLGTEVANAFTTSELFSLLNTRLLQKRPVVISTNLSPSRWSDTYSDRIVSRIYGNYISLGFTGSDIRLRKFR